MATQTSYQSRQDIFDSVTQISHLTQQPTDFLTSILVQQQQYTCLEWLWKFKVLTEIPLPPDSISYRDVAAKIQVDESTLRSVARMAMTTNFLQETKDGRLAHNSLSAVFVEDANMATWMSYAITRSVPCMRAFPLASERWPFSTKGNETAYNLALGTDLSFFGHLKANPELGAEFGKYMNSQSTVHGGTTVDHLTIGLDWAALGRATVVDVGGNNGSASRALASTFPDLRFIVEDLPGPIQNARAQAESLQPEVKARIEFVEHDFFTPQPVKDADVYLLRMIIHDWADADAARILKELVAVMKPESRIVIMDMVLPTPKTGSRTLEAAMRQKDLTMRQVLNAKEREVEDWHALVQSVDPTLHIVAIRRPEGSQHSVIEIAYSPKS